VRKFPLVTIGHVSKFLNKKREKGEKKKPKTCCFIKFSTIQNCKGRPNELQNTSNIFTCFYPLPPVILKRLRMYRFFIGVGNSWINFPQLSGASAIIARRINNADRRMYRSLSMRDLRGIRIERRRLVTVSLLCPATPLQPPPRYLLAFALLRALPGFAMLAVYEGKYYPVRDQTVD